MALFRLSLVALTGALVVAAPASAQPGGWGGSGGFGSAWGNSDWGNSDWGNSDWDQSRSRESRRSAADRSIEGRIQVSHFLAEGNAAQALGHGRIAVVGAPGDHVGPDPRQLATYEAAVIDRLARVGYDTANLDPAGGQITELTISHDEVAPPEAPHRPVSGAMEVGVSNRGSMLGMAINVDLTKPLKALVATRLEARIRDRATKAVLWEGRADIITREGDPRWSDQVIATKLAGALFGDFPGHTGETVAVR